MANGPEDALYYFRYGLIFGARKRLKRRGAMFCLKFHLADKRFILNDGCPGDYFNKYMRLKTWRKMERKPAFATHLEIYAWGHYEYRGR